MIGMTEEQAKKMFIDLWPGRQQEWSFEGPHFFDMCLRFGPDVLKDAKYEIEKYLKSGKKPTNEIAFFFGCAKRIAAEQSLRSARAQKRSNEKDECTPPGFDSYGEYFEYLCRKIQDEFPDTLEQMDQRIRESTPIDG
jgi:hypothetical protein